jgi:2-methylisocitrate lyase-like PEP mutase family enzyme
VELNRAEPGELAYIRPAIERFGKPAPDLARRPPGRLCFGGMSPVRSEGNTDGAIPSTTGQASVEVALKKGSDCRAAYKLRDLRRIATRVLRVFAKASNREQETAMGLKADLARTDTVSQIVSVHNALAAKIANEFAFDWLSVGGYNISGSAFGMPDVGLLTMTEQVEAVRRIANVAEAPIIADGDDGYGNYLNVMRLVREMQQAGASAIHIEDQVLPKKCGHMEGKRIVPQADFIAKIHAFVDTRTSEDFLLFARTDAIAVGGFDEAVDRANAYREAGADVIFVEAPTSIEQVERLPQLVDAPLLYNWVFRGKSPLVPRNDLLRLGYRFLLQADILYAVTHALRGYFSELKTTSSYGAWEERMISFDEFNELIGLQAIVDAEALYEPASLARD